MGVSEKQGFRSGVPVESFFSILGVYVVVPLMFANSGKSQSLGSLKRTWNLCGFNWVSIKQIKL